MRSRSTSASRGDHAYWNAIVCEFVISRSPLFAKPIASSVSVSPDMIDQTREIIANAEAKLGRAPKA